MPPVTGDLVMLPARSVRLFRSTSKGLVVHERSKLSEPDANGRAYTLCGKVGHTARPNGPALAGYCPICNMS